MKNWRFYNIWKTRFTKLFQLTKKVSDKEVNFNSSLIYKNFKLSFNIIASLLLLAFSITFIVFTYQPGQTGFARFTSNVWQSPSSPHDYNLMVFNLAGINLTYYMLSYDVMGMIVTVIFLVMIKIITYILDYYYFHKRKLLAVYDLFYLTFFFAMFFMLLTSPAFQQQGGFDVQKSNLYYLIFLDSNKWKFGALFYFTIVFHILTYLVVGFLFLYWKFGSRFGKKSLAKINFEHRRKDEAEVKIQSTATYTETQNLEASSDNGSSTTPIINDTNNQKGMHEKSSS